MDQGRKDLETLHWEASRPSIGVASDTNKIYVVKPGNITEINGKTNKIAANISLTKLPFPLRGIEPVITSDRRGKDTIYAVRGQF